jgi:hypothetical protein
MSSISTCDACNCDESFSFNFSGVTPELAASAMAALTAANAREDKEENGDSDDAGDGMILDFG